jgi:hypothetical protein
MFDTQLQYSGLYVSHKYNAQDHAVEYHRYLRFYADGVVLEVTTTEPPHEVIDYLERANPSVAHGYYAANEDGVIHFAVSAYYGVIVFAAQLRGDSLVADLYGHVESEYPGYAPTGPEQYRFIHLLAAEPLILTCGQGEPPWPIEYCLN